MTKPPRLREGPLAIRLDVADDELRARLLALLGADERYRVRWHAPAGGMDDSAVVIADRPVTASGAALIVLADDLPAAPPDAAAVLPSDTTGEVLDAAITLVAAGLIIGPETRPRPRPRGGRSPLADARMADAGEGEEPARRPLELAPEGAALTAREHEVLVLIAAGATNKMIARRLAISVHTAKFHVGSVLAKLGARGRSDAIAIGLRRGLLLL